MDGWKDKTYEKKYGWMVGWLKKYGLLDGKK